MRMSLAILLFTGACGSSEITAEQAKMIAVAVLPGGTAVSAVRGTSGAEVLYQVQVQMPNAGTIDVYLDIADGSLHLLETKLGPFNYEVRPLTTVIAFSQAVAIAQQNKTGAVEAWKFENE